MKKEHLEQYISRKMWKRRAILILIAILLFAAAGVSAHFREATKQIVHNGYYTRNVYNSMYLPLIIGGMVGGTASAVAVLSDFLFCRFKTVYKDDQYLTVYRGIIFLIVYVDGVEKGRSIRMRESMLVEVWLKGPVRATVHFTGSPANLAHISFSDHTATIEV